MRSLLNNSHELYFINANFKILSREISAVEKRRFVNAGPPQGVSSNLIPSVSHFELADRLHRAAFQLPSSLLFHPLVKFR